MRSRKSALSFSTTSLPSSKRFKHMHTGSIGRGGQRMLVTAPSFLGSIVKKCHFMANGFRLSIRGLAYHMLPLGFGGL